MVRLIALFGSLLIVASANGSCQDGATLFCEKDGYQFALAVRAKAAWICDSRGVRRPLTVRFFEKLGDSAYRVVAEEPINGDEDTLLIQTQRRETGKVWMNVKIQSWGRWESLHAGLPCRER